MYSLKFSSRHTFISVKTAEQTAIKKEGISKVL